MKYIGISDKIYNSLSMFAEATGKEVSDVVQNVFSEFLASDEFNFTIMNHCVENIFYKII